MKEKIAPRVLLTGTASGCGKTTITCGILSAFKRKYDISAYKCGPDYIDPKFHREAIQVTSNNLDSFFYQDEVLKYLFTKNTRELSIIEGVMGFYDGRAINSLEGSSYDIAKILDIPTILICPCKGTAHSVLPLIQGFLQYQRDHNIRGIILNHVTKSTFLQLKPLIEDKFPDISLVGYLPKLPNELILENRHLGLILPEELEKIQEKMEQLGNVLAETIDLDKIISIAQQAPPVEYESIAVEPLVAHGEIKIGVPLDEAFCFYYKDNLTLLEELGAKLVYFSPLHEKKLPEELDGLYLGGGYPELHLEKLSDNKNMREEILSFLQDKKPCIAECGGYLYLTREINGKEMVGFFEETGYNQNKLGNFGYVTLKAEKDQLLCKKGVEIKGHEFHYYTTTDTGSGFFAEKPNKKSWNVGQSGDSFYAGFPHLAFYSNLEIPRNFINQCKVRKYEWNKGK